MTTGIELVADVRAKLASGKALRHSDITALCDALEQASHGTSYLGTDHRRAYMRDYMRRYREAKRAALSSHASA